MSLETILARIDTDQPAALDRLFELLRIPSISTDPAHAGDVRRAADWLRADLAAMGFAAEIHDTPGHPMVVGQMDGPGPHLLFYGHYDVQPVDPLNLWHRDPFDPELQETPKGRVIRGRGTADDKGQLMTFLEACRAILAEEGTLPCKVTVFLEGEEESGSPSLVPYLKERGGALKADLALICDTGMFSDTVPAIVTQLRGLLGEELTITGPRIDLHSGMYGGIAMNPIRVLTKILSNLHDDTGRVQVPGFYDEVEELLPELARMGGSASDERAFLGEVGLWPSGQAGARARDDWSRSPPRLNGITAVHRGGLQDRPASQATARSRCRLVAGQDRCGCARSFRALGRRRHRCPQICSPSFAPTRRPRPPAG